MVLGTENYTGCSIHVLLNSCQKER